MARRSRAPQPRYIVNIEPAILAARSPSRMPSSVPMSQCGTRWCGAVGVGVEALDAEHDVVRLAGAVGAVGRREVRRAEQQVAHLRRRSRRPRASSAFSSLAERPALGHQRLGAVGVALAPPLPDLLREHLDPRAQVVALGAERALLHVELEDAVDVGRRVAAAPGEPGAHGVGFGAEAADVEHGPRR